MTRIDILRGKRLKTGDTLPDLRAQLYTGGNPINLSSYTVTMKMKRSDGDELLVDEQITVDDESRGIVTYSWDGADTNTNGTYLLEFVAENGSGDKISFPSNSFERVYIEDGLST